MEGAKWPCVQGYGMDNPDVKLFALENIGAHPQYKGYDLYSLTPHVGYFVPLHGFNDGRMSVDFLRLDGAGEPTYWRFITRRPRYADEADTLDQIDGVRLATETQQQPETIQVLFVSMAEAWELIDAGCNDIIVVQYSPYSFIYCPTVEAGEKIMALLPEACSTYGGEDPNRPGFQVSLHQGKVLAALKPLMCQ